MNFVTSVIQHYLMPLSHIHTHTHTYTHTHIHTDTQTHRHTDTHTHIHTYTHTHIINAHTHTLTHTHIHRHTCTHTDSRILEIEAHTYTRTYTHVCKTGPPTKMMHDAIRLDGNLAQYTLSSCTYTHAPGIQKVRIYTHEHMHSYPRTCALMCNYTCTHYPRRLR